MKTVRVNLISVTTAWRAAKKGWNQLFSAGIEDVTRGMSHRDRAEIMKSICSRRVMSAWGSSPDRWSSLELKKTNLLLVIMLLQTGW